MTALLTTDDLKELTDCARPAGQLRWLQDHGWTFEISATGRPKVDRAEYERHMIGGKRHGKRTTEPDLEWFSGQEKEEESASA